MRKPKLRYVLFFIAGTGAILLAANMLLMGKAPEKSGKDFIYYFPAQYSGGYVPYNRISSDDKSGAAVIYSPHGTWGFVSEKDKHDENVPSFPIYKNEMGSNLYGAYYEDGKLGAVLYYEVGRNYEFETFHYILVRAYDENDKRIDDLISLCAENYAADIASAISETYGDEKIYRIFLQSAYDEADKNHIEIKVLTESSSELSFKDAERLRLLNLNKTDSLSLLKAVITAAGDENKFDITEKAVIRTAELLNSGQNGDFCRAEDFSAEVRETENSDSLE